MRHATRSNLANGAYVLAGLCCALGAGAYLTLRNQPPEIVTVTEYRYLPGEKCVALEVVDKDAAAPGLLDRILHPHRRRVHGASSAAAVPALPPLVCPAPEGPITRRGDVEVHTVAEPGTLALMALVVPLIAIRRRG